MEPLSTLQQLPFQAIAALAAGVVILLAPRALNYTIAAYLVFIGGLGLLRAYHGAGVPPQSLVALVAGVMVLIKPEVLSYIVGAYLILVGLLQAGILRAW